MQIQYRIPEANLPELTGRIDKLARRAAKLKLPPISLKTVSHEDVPLYNAPGNARPVEAPPSTAVPRGWEPTGGFNRYLLVSLAGEAPVLPDWDLLAIVEHGDSEVGNVVRTVPGRSLPAAYRTAANLCQHCNTSRRRSETFVLRHQSTGTLKQVGRNCLADFCRDADAAEAMCRMAELLQSAAGLCGMAEGEGFGGGGSGPRRVGAEHLLALTARLIRHLGWVSRSKARAAANEFDGSRPTATADVIREVLFNPQFFTPSRRDSTERIELRAAAPGAHRRRRRCQTNNRRHTSNPSCTGRRATSPTARPTTTACANTRTVPSSGTGSRRRTGATAPGTTWAKTTTPDPTTRPARTRP